jgi:UDP-N-acetylmuramoylalanine--D-glutamate ligase
MITLVYGLGESGLAAARALAERGEEVVVADSDDSEHLRGIVRVLGVEGRLGVRPEVLEEGFGRIVTSPLIRPQNPVLVAAEDRGVPVLSEIGLGLDILSREAPGVKVVGVTGTNGKTTVVDMLRAILTAASVPHAVAGNSWRALTGCLDEVREKGTLVLELSSFQLHYLPEPGFDIAALLNVRPDHLNWHTSFEEYVADKLRVFEGQEPGDLALVSATDEVGRDVSEKLSATTVVVGKGETLVVGEKLLVRGRSLAGVGELPFAGPHNHENALFAATVAEDLGVELEGIREGLLGYRIKPHRMRVVAERDGVVYVDDSKATNPAAVAAALASFEGPVVLILGGSEKDTDFSELLGPIERCCRAVVCHGEAGPRIFEFLEEKGLGMNVFLETDLTATVARAQRAARPGDAVLLSPGCASFDQFGGYAERGTAFALLVSARGDGSGETPKREAVGR